MVKQPPEKAQLPQVEMIRDQNTGRIIGIRLPSGSVIMDIKKEDYEEKKW